MLAYYNDKLIGTSILQGVGVNFCHLKFPDDDNGGDAAAWMKVKNWKIKI